MSWPPIKLGEICLPKQHPTISSGELLDSGYTVYGANGPIGFYSTYTHTNPTIAVTCRGATCGTVNITPPNCYITGNAMALDKLDTARVDFNYLAHVLRYQGFKSVINGAAQPQITRAPMLEYEIPLPPLEEQKRIAGILDQADALRRLRARALEKLNTLGQAVFQEMFGDPETNPKGWPVGKVSDLLSEANYGTSGKANTDGQGLPILRMGNITYDGSIDLSNLKHIELSEKEFPKYTTQIGDLLFNRTNSKELVGKTAVVKFEEPMAIAGYLVRTRANELGNTDYISGYLNSRHGKATLMGMCKNIVGMANINAKEMQGIRIAIPPKTLQDEYSHRIDAIDGPRCQLSIALKESESLFSSLQSAAFQGKL